MTNKCLNPCCVKTQDMLNFMFTTSLSMQYGMVSGDYFLMSLHGNRCQKNTYATPEEAIDAWQTGKDKG